MLDYQSNDFKSLEDLKEICPTIFTKKGSSEVSDKYTHIPTEQVIRDMETLGWFVADAKQVKTRAAARQLVNHGHVKVNGRKVNIPSYTMKEGDEIAIKDRDGSKALVQRNLELSSRREVPQWLILTKEELKGQVARMPLREEMPSVADELMIVELYSK